MITQSPIYTIVAELNDPQTVFNLTNRKHLETLIFKSEYGDNEVIAHEALNDILGKMQKPAKIKRSKNSTYFPFDKKSKKMEDRIMEEVTVTLEKKTIGRIFLLVTGTVISPHAGSLQ